MTDPLHRTNTKYVMENLRTFFRLHEINKRSEREV